MVRTRTCCHFGISLSKPLMAQVDVIRGDTPRSKIIQRALESMIKTFESKKPQCPQVPAQDTEALVFDETIPTRGTAE